jgi:hypothetical protein
MYGSIENQHSTSELIPLVATTVSNDGKQPRGQIYVDAAAATTTAIPPRVDDHIIHRQQQQHQQLLSQSHQRQQLHLTLDIDNDDDEHHVNTRQSYGKWNDHLFDCCRGNHTGRHRSRTLLLALCCPQILMGRILQQLHLDWYGRHTTATSSSSSSSSSLFHSFDHHDHRTMNSSCNINNTFRRVLCIVVMYWTLIVLLRPPTSKWIQDPDTGTIHTVHPRPDDISLIKMFLYNLIHYAFGAYTVLTLINVRTILRQRYRINTSSSLSDCFRCGALTNKVGNNSTSTASAISNTCLHILATPMNPNPIVCHVLVPIATCEDLCVSLWCGCCSVAQMARHIDSHDVTTDDDDSHDNDDDGAEVHGAQHLSNSSISSSNLSKHSVIMMV